ncbi:hypothetical protein FIV00_15115 [Labrenzia sp. THAF82]|uniref:tail fiber domain-containing protein n=1 Tax=Labrenzia sp. THAF82 TaxID=2587861 RepID=UPI001267D2D7|nr:tail fiber domain-containing protein [Labrenzia sp. THAF82]QFT31821.1 hypothetical protein FIV00_15115 [Labrenzia sp. THAF82]
MSTSNYDIDVILRDHITQGDSGSGPHKPLKSQLRAYLKSVETGTLDRYNSKVDVENNEVRSSVLSVLTHGYTAAGDGGGALYKRVDAEPSHPGKFRSADRYLTDGGTDATNGGWWEIDERITTPKMYGAIGDGVNDDTVALQDCITSGRFIDLTGGIYRITDTIQVAVSKSKIFSAALTTLQGFAVRQGAILVDNPSIGIALNCTSTGTIFENIYIYSAAQITAEAIHFDRSAGSSSDRDHRVIGVSIVNFSTCIKMIGRGLHVKDCQFSTATFGVVLDWPASWTPNGAGNDTTITAGRSYVITNNLFHDCDNWVTNEGTENPQNIRSVVVSGNLGDLGGCIFRGVLVDGAISGNICNLSDYVYTMRINDGSRNSAISGNVMGGLNEGGEGNQPNHCVYMTPETIGIKNIAFTGNVFGPTHQGSIRIDGDAATTNISFVGNTFQQPGLDGFSPIYLEGVVSGAKDLSLIANTFDLTGSAAATIIGGDNNALIRVLYTNNSVQNNAIPVAQSNVIVYQDGPALGMAEYVHTVYSARGGSSWVAGDTVVGGHVVYSADTSGPGAGIVGGYKILAGDTTLNSTIMRLLAKDSSGVDHPTVDITTSYMRPVFSNEMSCGSSNRLWTAVYATNGTIQTSDERLKDFDARPLGEQSAVIAAAKKISFRSYRWIDDDGKTHFGVSAQAVMEAFASFGLDALEYGLVREEGGSFFVSYTELLALKLAALETDDRPAH